MFLSLAPAHASWRSPLHLEREGLDVRDGTPDVGAHDVLGSPATKGYVFRPCGGDGGGERFRQERPMSDRGKSEFVGREAQLEVLDTMLSRALAGEVSVVRSRQMACPQSAVLPRRGDALGTQ